MTTAHVVALGRDTFDLELGQFRVDAALQLLDGLGVDVVGDRTIASDPGRVADAIERLDDRTIDAVVLLQATFADASAAIAIGETSDAPLLIWSFPEDRHGGDLRLNSMCGANLAAFSLRQRARPAEFIHLDPRRCDASARLSDALAQLVERSPVDRSPAWPLAGPIDPARARAADRTASALRGRRVGVIGERPVGFEPCDADDDDIERILGVHVERITLHELFDRSDAADERAVRECRVRIGRTVHPEPTLDAHGVDRATHLAAGLDGLADEHGWDAVATRCWPECMNDYGAAACTAQSLLAERGIPAVCEADILGAVTALVLSELTDGDPFVADLVDADPGDDTSVLWHCGCASPTLAAPTTPIRGIAHPNRKVPLVNQFALRSGRVTIARLSRLGGSLSMVVAGGTMLDRPRPFSGTCGVVRWDLPVDDVVRTIFDEGIEHHLVVAYGEHRDALVALAERWGLPVVRLGHPRG